MARYVLAAFLAVILASGVVSAANISTSVYYFDNNTNDAVGNITLSSYNNPSFVPGVRNSAIRFDGVNQYVKGTGNPTVFDSFSWAGWFYDEDTSSSVGLFDVYEAASWGCIYGMASAGGSISLYVCNGYNHAILSKAGISQNTWHYIVVTAKQNGQMKIYLDGNTSPAVGSVLSGSLGGLLNGETYLGVHNPAGPVYGWTKGRFDDVRFYYGRELTSAEVGLLYAGVDIDNPASNGTTGNSTGSDNGGATYVISDDFYDGSNCNGGALSCGNSTDGVVKAFGTVNISLLDDGATDAACIVKVNGSDVTTQTCIFRQGVAITACNPIIDNTAPGGNRSYFYTCPSNNLSTCGWDGSNGIPVFANSAPQSWGWDTSSTGVGEFGVYSYRNCTGTQTVFEDTPVLFMVPSAIGVTCVGNDYAGIAYGGGYSRVFSGASSCTGGTFCDTTNSQNVTPGSPITGFYCTPGCSDGRKNGQETEVDYGGSVCGNCTPERSKDTYYPFAKDLALDDLGRLDNTHPFNSSAYCKAGEETGSSVFFILFVTIFVAGVAVFLLFFIALPVLMVIVALIVRFLKTRKKD